MINSIIDSISLAISNELNTESQYKIYTENVEQGLVEPCFFIFCVNPIERLFRNNKYYREHQYCVQYFPKGPEKNSETNDMSENLFNLLELIDVAGDLYRGTNINAEIVDGVLNVFVNYNTFVYKVEVEQEAMTELDVNTSAEE